MLAPQRGWLVSSPPCQAPLDGGPLSLGPACCESTLGPPRRDLASLYSKQSLAPGPRQMLSKVGGRDNYSSFMCHSFIHSFILMGQFLCEALSQTNIKNTGFQEPTA